MLGIVANNKLPKWILTDDCEFDVVLDDSGASVAESINDWFISEYRIQFINTKELELSELEKVFLAKHCLNLLGTLDGAFCKRFIQGFKKKRLDLVQVAYYVHCSYGSCEQFSLDSIERTLFTLYDVCQQLAVSNDGQQLIITC